MLTIDIDLPGGLIEGTDDLATARPAGFTVLVFTSLFRCFNAHLFVNPWLWGAVALFALLQVAIINSASSTSPSAPCRWLSSSGLLCLGDGQRGAAVQRTAQAGESRMEPTRMTPQVRSELRQSGSTTHLLACKP